MTDQFLPSDYKVQSPNSGYMKLEEGDNRVRILTKPLLGFELWINQKPRRIRMTGAFTQEDLDKADVSSYTGKKRSPAHFWAMTVWNYAEKKVQILQLNQVSIQREIANLSNDPDWGSPLDYDISINKREENSIVKYSVTPKPKKELMPDVKQIIKDTPVNLDALFDGGNPFEVTLQAAEEAKKPVNEDVDVSDIPF